MPMFPVIQGLPQNLDLTALCGISYIPIKYPRNIIPTVMS